MFNSVCDIGRAKLSLLLGIGLVSAGLLPGASLAFGQAPPQILPYTITTVAGGALTNPAAGAACPVSGLTSADAFGDGCLASEVVLNAPRFVTEDAQGNIFFSDGVNALVRRVDATTGVITAVAGGAAATPASGAACGAYVSTDSRGDGCLATAVKLGLPEGLAFAPNGDLYFADNSFDSVRRIAATNGVLLTTGVITNVVGNLTTFGYAVNNASGAINPATQGYLNFPYGITFDAAGNLYIADEGNNAIEVVNLTGATSTVANVSIPPGTIAKVVGYGSLNTKTAKGVDCPNFTAAATGSRGGCYFGTWVDGSPAITSNMDNDFDVAVDPLGNIYFTNEFNNNVGKVTAAGILSNYAGIQGGHATALVRGQAGTFGIGSDFELAVDKDSNLYVADAVNAVIWRVDASNKAMYVVAGGAATVCSAALDKYGNGCPAAQAVFSPVPLSGAFAASGGKGGVQGMHVDAAGNLLVADYGANLIRKLSSGTQFGTVNGSKPTQSIDVHFAAGDMPASNAFTFSTGASNFTILGNASCTSNSDTTQDCILIVQANPTVPGPFTSTLTVVSTQGKTANFTLSGTYVPVPTPSIATVSISIPGTSCTGNTVPTTAPTAISTTITPKNGSGTPTGTVTFYANGAQIGTPQTLNSASTASINYTFPAGNYAITVVYSGDAFFNPATSTAQNIVSTSPTFSGTTGPQLSTVAPGQSALYTITLNETLFAGTVSFSCSGLPAGAACVFSPSTLTGNGCSGSQTEALTITTTQPTSTASLALGGRGPWAFLGMLPGASLALLIAMRRRRSSSWMAGNLGRIWLALALLVTMSSAIACSNTQTIAGTPTGTSTVTLTMTSGAVTKTMPLTLTVH